jgi:hypothetical protein
MINYLRKQFGYHVCENFTEWENRKATYSRPVDLLESLTISEQYVEFTRRWQERKCKDCGKIQQRALRW